MWSARTAQLGLGAAAWLWVAAVVLAPGAVFPIAHFVCHQRTDRSFFFDGHQLAVCARCTGIYVGAAVAVPVALAFAGPLARSRARALLVLGALPTAITWTLEVAGVAPFSNAVRCIAGVPLGFAAAWLVFATLSQRSSDIGYRATTAGARTSVR